MASLPKRDLAAEAAKHFHGTAEERILECRRLGEAVLILFLASQPPGTTRAEARRTLQRNAHAGRRWSAVTGSR